MTNDLPLFAQPPRAKETGHLPELVIRALDEQFEAVPIGDTITAEILRDRVSYDMRQLLALPIYRNGLGGYMQRKARSGRVEHAGFVTAQRDDAKGRPIKLWRKCA